MKPKSLMEVYEAAKAGKVVKFLCHTAHCRGGFLTWHHTEHPVMITADTLNMDNWEIEELPYQHPERLEAGQLWEKEGYSDLEFVVVGKNGVGFSTYVYRDGRGSSGGEWTLSELIRKGWKLKEGA